MDMEAKVLPNALGSIVAYLMFRKYKGYLLHVAVIICPEEACSVVELAVGYGVEQHFREYSYIENNFHFIIDDVAVVDYDRL
jgi:ribosomal protein L19